jgi:hypothetical protein
MKKGNKTLTKVIVITLIAAVVITYSVSVVAYLF